MSQSQIDALDHRLHTIEGLIGGQFNANDTVAKYIHKLEDEVQQAHADILQSNIDSDVGWMLACAFVVLMIKISAQMQSGFAMLESGLVSMRSSGNVISKNAADIGISAAAFLCFGWTLQSASGGPVSGFIGFDPADMFALKLGGADYPLWVFGFAFAATSTTIISGSVAERLVFKAYLWIAFVSTGLAYPLAARWIWHEDGFLNSLGAHDLAGCSAVHMVGGIQGLVGTVMLGPRIGVFTGTGKDRRYWPTRSSSTNVLFGTFLLLAGWLAFNAGSTLGISNGVSSLAGKVAMNTALGAGGGVVASIVYGYWKSGNTTLDVVDLAGGTLGGLVAITAGADLFDAWEAFLCGCIGGPAAIFFGEMLVHLGVDDPAQASGLHGGVGAVGLLLAGLLGPEAGLLRTGKLDLIGAQLATVGVVTAFAVLVGLVSFGSWDWCCGGIRVPEEDERIGLDEVEHGMALVKLFDETDFDAGDMDGDGWGGEYEDYDYDYYDDEEGREWSGSADTKAGAAPTESKGQGEEGGGMSSKGTGEGRYLPRSASASMAALPGFSMMGSLRNLLRATPVPEGYSGSMPRTRGASLRSLTGSMRLESVDEEGEESDDGDAGEKGRTKDAGGPADQAGEGAAPLFRAASNPEMAARPTQGSYAGAATHHRSRMMVKPPSFVIAPGATTALQFALAQQAFKAKQRARLRGRLLRQHSRGAGQKWPGEFSRNVTSVGSRGGQYRGDHQYPLGGPVVAEARVAKEGTQGAIGASGGRHAPGWRGRGRGRGRGRDGGRGRGRGRVRPAPAVRRMHEVEMYADARVVQDDQMAKQLQQSVRMRSRNSRIAAEAAKEAAGYRSKTGHDDEYQHALPEGPGGMDTTHRMDDGEPAGGLSPRGGQLQSSQSTRTRAYHSKSAGEDSDNHASTVGRAKSVGVLPVGGTRKVHPA